MRVVHLSTFDVVGGAARGTYALHEALVDIGVDSHIVVEQATVDDPRVHGDQWPGARYVHAARHRLDRLPLRSYRDREDTIFSHNRVPSGVVGRVKSLEPDVVHLHWLGTSFVRPEDIPRFGVPVVWTLRDMWPFTGGCHTAGDCRRYMQLCGKCPRLGSTKDDDLSRSIWLRKKQAWQDVDLTFVAMSQWSAVKARESSLLGNRKIHVIPNAIDTDFWIPGERELSQITANRPKRVLFIALNLFEKHKGFHLFVEACLELAKQSPKPNLEIRVVGDSTGVGTPDLGFPNEYLGRLESDEPVRDSYRWADVTVVPSTQETFGKTAAEALACGTPCVVFADTGPSSVVSNRETGYIATYADSGALAEGIGWVVADQRRWTRLSEAGQVAARERFSSDVAAHQYIGLYSELLSATH